MRAVLLPLDDRPVTYTFPQMVAQVAGVEAVAPPRHLLGSLERPASVNDLAMWLGTAVSGLQPDALLVCLDSLFYGGLIPSRRSPETLDQVLKRSEQLKSWKKASAARVPKVFAQSSIMRISDNYDATEEKDYWAKYGREIFAWSEILHRLSDGQQLHKGQLAQLEMKIPATIRDDYRATRARNFRVNRGLLDYVDSGVVDFLAFSLDDSGQFGLNILEKRRLLDEARERNLLSKVVAYAGADEVLCTLIARWLISVAGSQPNIVIGFSQPAAAACPSRYEGQTIGDTLRAQLAALGLDESEKPDPSLDFIVVVHASQNAQGDHILLDGHKDLRSINTQDAVASTMKILESVALPCVICDVAYANGADPLLVEQLLSRKDLLNKVWAYGGWNTTGNTMGSVISQAVAYWFARKKYANDTAKLNASIRALKQALLVRLADDWAYQTQVRPQLTQTLSPSDLAARMQPHIERIAAALDLPIQSCRVGFPWNRTFEVEVDLLSGGHVGVAR